MSIMIDETVHAAGALPLSGRRELVARLAKDVAAKKAPVKANLVIVAETRDTIKGLAAKPQSPSQTSIVDIMELPAGASCLVAADILIYYLGEPARLICRIIDRIARARKSGPSSPRPSLLGFTLANHGRGSNEEVDHTGAATEVSTAFFERGVGSVRWIVWRQ